MGIGLDLCYGLAVAASSPIWAVNLLRTGKWRTDWPARLGLGESVAGVSASASATPKNKRLLIHAVSVGEVNAIRQLVDKLDQQAGDVQLIISVTTDTGFARAKQLFASRFQVVRYPFDMGFCVKRFLDRVKPNVVALVENEVWPNFAQACQKRDVPLLVINGRLSARSFARYQKIKPLARSMFGRLAGAAVQLPMYAKHFKLLGTPADQVVVLDNMKWDTAVMADDVEGADELAKEMGIDRSRPLIVAGSTGPGEDQLLIDTCPQEAQLLLVPRKPEWFEFVARLSPGIVRRSAHRDQSSVAAEKLLVGQASRLSSAGMADPPPQLGVSRQGPGSGRPSDGQRLFLLDTIGELTKAYALADVAIVGRSFLGLFGSDVIEPIALGKPTLIGPCHGDFADIVDAFVQGQGIIVTDKPGQVAGQLLADKQKATQLASRGRDVILARQGATQRHVDWLGKWLSVPTHTP